MPYANNHSDYYRTATNIIQMPRSLLLQTMYLLLLCMYKKVIHACAAFLSLYTYR